MSSTAIIAQGITIARMGTTAFETIPNVVSFQGPGGQAQVIDVTNLSSTAKEKRMGLRDEGSLSLSLHFDPDNAVHDGLRSDRANRTRQQFRITFTDTIPTVWTFYGYVTQFSVQGGVDAVVEASVTIEIDGDIIMNKYFIEDHLTFAQNGQYLFGSRVNIQEKLLPKLFSEKIIDFNLFSKGIKKRGRTIRIPFFMQFAKSVNQRSRKLRGCNMSFWKDDFIKINGFNEDLVGWGIDDSEMIQRLHNIGIRGKRLKFAGIAYHIYHKEQSKSNLEINNEIGRQTTENKLTFIEKGINQYL